MRALEFLELALYSRLHISPNMFFSLYLLQARSMTGLLHHIFVQTLLSLSLDLHNLDFRTF